MEWWLYFKTTSLSYAMMMMTMTQVMSGKCQVQTGVPPNLGPRPTFGHHSSLPASSSSPPVLPTTLSMVVNLILSSLSSKRWLPRYFSSGRAGELRNGAICLLIWGRIWVKILGRRQRQWFWAVWQAGDFDAFFICEAINNNALLTTQKHNRLNPGMDILDILNRENWKVHSEHNQV